MFNRKEDITIYSAKKINTSFFTLLADIIKGMYSGRIFARQLLITNINVKYRQSYLGILWAFIPPIMTTLIWVFLNMQKVVVIEVHEMSYPVFVLIGTLLWQIFVDAIHAPFRVVNSARNILSKINFPHEALILTILGETFFATFIRFFLLVMVYFLFSIEPPFSIIYAPFGILLLILFGVAIGILFIPFSMLFKDFELGLNVLTSFCFFLTPIIYPSPNSGIASIITKWNPLNPLIQNTRNWLITGNTPFLIDFYIVVFVIFFLLLFSLVFYHSSMTFIIERLGS